MGSPYLYRPGIPKLKLLRIKFHGCIGIEWGIMVGCELISRPSPGNEYTTGKKSSSSEASGSCAAKL